MTKRMQISMNMTHKTHIHHPNNNIIVEAMHLQEEGLLGHFFRHRMVMLVGVPVGEVEVVGVAVLLQDKG